jgi:hypothetical protein
VKVNGCDDRGPTSYRYTLTTLFGCTGPHALYGVTLPACAWLYAGRWSYTAHPFWTTPWPFCFMAQVRRAEGSRGGGPCKQEHPWQLALHSVALIYAKHNVLMPPM